MSAPLQLSRILDNKYPQKQGIWHCLPESNTFQRAYDQLHTHPFDRANDGSFEVLAAFARGNRTLDIACGDGFLEQLDPTIVGLEFSLHALQKARAHGAKYLVLADAHHLPFKNKSFDLCICTGSLEHFTDPQLALAEMARVSSTQIVVVHRPYPIPLANQLRSLLLKLKHIPDQPYDHPLTLARLHALYAAAHLKIIYEGVWTFPYNLEALGLPLSRMFYLPSCHFLISRA